MTNKNIIGGTLTALLATATLATTFSLRAPDFDKISSITTHHSNILTIDDTVKTDKSHKHHFAFMHPFATEDLSDSTFPPLRHEDSLTKENKNKIIEDGIEFKRYITSKDSTYHKKLTDSILATIHPSTFTEVVDYHWLKGSIAQESHYNPNAKSSTGGRGSGQFMRKAWKAFGEGRYEQNVYDPVKNIYATLKYKLWLEDFLSEVDKKWEKRTVDEKRKLIELAYYDGQGKLKGDLAQAHYNLAELPKYSSEKGIKHADHVFARVAYIKYEENQAKIAYLIMNKDSTRNDQISGKEILN